MGRSGGAVSRERASVDSTQRESASCSVDEAAGMIGESGVAASGGGLPHGRHQPANRRKRPMLSNLPPLLLAHFIAACLAMPLGLYQIMARQGTPGHALAGRLYVPAMLVCNLSALATFSPSDPRFNGFLPFYILALVSLYALASGMLALRRWLQRRNDNDLKTHKIQMAFSWLGLMMAGVSQVITNHRFGIAEGFEPVRFWTMVIVINVVLYAVGSWWIFGRLLKRKLG
jgi:uncharacterized membrane protein